MFAILLIHENMPKIIESMSLSPADEKQIAFYLRRSGDYYAIQGYVDPRGKLWEGLTVLPAYILPHQFVIDLEHASTDWDQIVRKPK